jgi:fructosamine-3-kinase
MAAHFVKRNQSRYPDQLLREAQGLEALRGALAAGNAPPAGTAPPSGIGVPEVIQVDERSLTLTFIQASVCSAPQWRRLGKGLAGMHAQAQPRFGFHEDNYIGLNPQPNAFSGSWGDFFLRQRLEFQVELMQDRQRRRRFSDCLRQHGARLREFLDSGATVPSLVHGDLWIGNVICGEDERVWLIDPAVYHGDADVDLAMTEMFGGFPAEFYAAYRACRPEPVNWALKKQIYNLYHYLNHMNLFGHAYLERCEAGFEMLGKI